MSTGKSQKCEIFLQIIFLSSTSILFNQHISLKHVRLLPPCPALGGGGESCDEISLSARFIKLEHVAFHKNLNKTYPLRILVHKIAHSASKSNNVYKA